MATTTSDNLYNPEVWAALAAAEFTNKAVVGTSPAVIEDPSLEGVPGSTVEFPSWMPLGDLDVLTENVAMTPATLTQKSTKATVREAGKAVEITDTAKLVGLGNAQDEGIRQFGVLAARHVDAALIAAAEIVVPDGVTYADGTAATASSPLTFAPAATTEVPAGTAVPFGWNTFVDATAPFGDDLEPAEFAGVFINSAQRAELFKDEMFVKAEAGNGESVVRRGVIGDLGGIPVYVTNRVAAGTFLVLKNNSLGLLYKRRPIVEQDRDILKRTTVVTTNLHYAVHRLNDKGVLVGSLVAA